ncbi:MAG: xanthine phosphoribosyltransferase [Rhodospirillaceae bacterium]
MIETPNTTDLFVTWADLHRETRQLVERLLRGDAGRGPWRGIVAITRGGMVPAAVIARETNIRLIETLSVANYDGQKQGALKVLAEPPQAVRDRGVGWLVVDDIVDSGRTAQAARGLLPEAAIVTLYSKPGATKFVDLYLHLARDDQWVHFPWDTADRAGNPVFQPPMGEAE